MKTYTAVSVFLLAQLSKRNSIKGMPKTVCFLKTTSATKKLKRKILTKIYQQKLECRTESTEISISEHGTFYSDSIENFNCNHERSILLYIRV